MIVRRVVLAPLALLVACAHPTEEFATHPPSLHVGEVALHSGEPAIAESIANTNLAVSPGDMDALLLRSDAQAAQGQADAAELGYRQVLAAEPGSPGAALGLARLLMGGDPRGAEGLLAPLAGQKYVSAAVWNDLGVARDLQGKHADAQTAYRRALQTDPLMRSAQVNLARSLAQTKESGAP